jgi:hypothetical protein
MCIWLNEIYVMAPPLYINGKLMLSITLYVSLQEVWVALGCKIRYKYSCVLTLVDVMKCLPYVHIGYEIILFFTICICVWSLDFAS